MDQIYARFEQDLEIFLWVTFAAGLGVAVCAGSVLRKMRPHRFSGDWIRMWVTLCLTALACVAARANPINLICVTALLCYSIALLDELRRRLRSKPVIGPMAARTSLADHRLGSAALLSILLLVIGTVGAGMVELSHRSREINELSDEGDRHLSAVSDDCAVLTAVVDSFFAQQHEELERWRRGSDVGIYDQYWKRASSSYSDALTELIMNDKRSGDNRVEFLETFEQSGKAPDTFQRQPIEPLRQIGLDSRVVFLTKEDPISFDRYRAQISLAPVAYSPQGDHAIVFSHLSGWHRTDLNFFLARKGDGWVVVRVQALYYQ